MWAQSSSLLPAQPPLSNYLHECSISIFYLFIYHSFLDGIILLIILPQIQALNIIMDSNSNLFILFFFISIPFWSFFNSLMGQVFGGYFDTEIRVFFIKNIGLKLDRIEHNKLKS